jgi:hypothetical protein
MRKVINKLRLFLCTFSGEDDYIIRKCSDRIQISFALIGVFVLFVFGGCFVSATAFISELFGHFNAFCLLVGILWALIVTTIYLLLLYTISPTLLPVGKKKTVKGKKIHIDINIDVIKPKSSFTSSLVLRIIFISVLAFIIAQPLNVLVLSNSIQSDIENFKMEYRVNMLVKSDSLFIQDELIAQREFYSNMLVHQNLSDSLEVINNVGLINRKILDDSLFINSSISHLKSLNQYKISKANKINTDSIRNILASLLINQIHSDSMSLISFGNIYFANLTLQKDYIVFNNEFHKIIDNKIDNYYKLNSLLDRSNFYVTRIKLLLEKNIVSWLLTLLGCMVFLVPIYLKFLVRNYTDFYNRKEEIEKKLVVDAYQNFKLEYVETFNEKFILINERTNQTIYPLLEEIKTIDSKKYKLLVGDLKNEMVYRPIHKFEYWADMPYRTTRQKNNQVLSEEKDLLTQIYNS